MNDNLQIDLDFATLDLVGERYNEAEKKYISIIKEHYNSSLAWIGLGLSKYKHLASEIQYSEIVYCFKKAKEFSPESAKEIDALILIVNYEIINTFCYDYTEAHRFIIDEDYSFSNKSVYNWQRI
jgi:hypothetical protein